ncbi:FAD-dependent oxidoreductase [uncultured Brevundimonas sp.]|uniref:NAD(P)/FAD-dependent oxidoreductase n=1 Tax=uncultured Brevundimonas sp. TaxID=213418 RepID=UPI00261ACC93|nr:FAD-dependent oxidoreductase [uncultured Brevundimonas sp.]
MTGTDSSIVIVGGGVAGLSLASELAARAPDRSVVVLQDEPHAAYDRPPLSKAYLLDGDADAVALSLPGLDRVDIRSGVRAEAVDAEARSVALSTGGSLTFGQLVFATGARARSLPSLTAGALPVCVLRGLDDARALRSHLVAGSRLVILGGGIIGLEVAATARTIGAQVTVVEALPRLLSRSGCPLLSIFLREAHEQRGVKFHLGRTVSSVTANSVVLDDGARIPADVILVAAGVIPNTELAAAAGAACDNGILVDDLGRTSLPDIWAIGDCSRAWCEEQRTHVRSETWTRAREQAAVVAMALCGLPTASASEAPAYYWSDQYDLKIQVAGSPMGDLDLVRGDMSAGSFSILHLAGGRLVGATAINAPRDLGSLKKIIRSRRPVDAEVLADLSTDLKALASPKSANAVLTA